MLGIWLGKSDIMSTIIKNWKRLLLIATWALAGCATNAGTGVIAGATLGAGSGSLIAGAHGIWIGTAVGAVSAGIIGFVLDEQDRKAVEKTSPRTVDRIDRGEPLTMNDIIKLRQAGVSDDTVIEYIRESKSSYPLSQGQIRRLQEAGVSQRVIEAMIHTNCEK
jgi:uncharacterized protein YcfJ